MFMFFGYFWVITSWIGWNSRFPLQIEQKQFFLIDLMSPDKQYLTNKLLSSLQSTYKTENISVCIIASNKSWIHLHTRLRCETAIFPIRFVCVLQLISVNFTFCLTLIRGISTLFHHLSTCFGFWIRQQCKLNAYFSKIMLRLSDANISTAYDVRSVRARVNETKFLMAL